VSEKLQNSLEETPQPSKDEKEKRENKEITRTEEEVKLAEVTKIIKVKTGDTLGRIVIREFGVTPKDKQKFLSLIQRLQNGRQGEYKLYNPNKIIPGEEIIYQYIRPKERNSVSIQKGPRIKETLPFDNAVKELSKMLKIPPESQAEFENLLNKISPEDLTELSKIPIQIEAGMDISEIRYPTSLEIIFKFLEEQSQQALKMQIINNLRRNFKGQITETTLANLAKAPFLKIIEFYEQLNWVTAIRKTMKEFQTKGITMPIVNFWLKTFTDKDAVDYGDIGKFYNRLLTGNFLNAEETKTLYADVDILQKSMGNYQFWNAVTENYVEAIARMAPFMNISLDGVNQKTITADAINLIALSTMLISGGLSILPKGIQLGTKTVRILQGVLALDTAITGTQAIQGSIEIAQNLQNGVKLNEMKLLIAITVMAGLGAVSGIGATSRLSDLTIPKVKHIPHKPTTKPIETINNADDIDLTLAGQETASVRPTELPDDEIDLTDSFVEMADEIPHKQPKHITDTVNEPDLIDPRRFLFDELPNRSLTAINNDLKGLRRDIMQTGNNVQELKKIEDRLFDLQSEIMSKNSLNDSDINLLDKIDIEIRRVQSRIESAPHPQIHNSSSDNMGSFAA